MLKTFFAKLILLHLFSLAQAAPIAPLNSVGVATSCDNVNVACTYTDATVKPGQQYFYFAVAEDSAGNYSVPSNVAYATVGATNTSVVLNWNPSQTGGVITYFLYRGTPATNLHITSSN